MNQLIKYSIKHPIAIFMYYLLLITMGIISLLTIPMDFLPKMKDHTLLLSTFYPGMSAEQMKETITIPEENAFSSLKGIKNMSSVTRDNCCFIKITLHDNTNINSALIESRQIIDQLSETLSEDCYKPEIEIFDSDKNLILNITASSDSKEISYVRKIISNDLKHALQTIPEIGNILISGGQNDQIQVLYDSSKLYSLKLTPGNLADAIINTNYEHPAGLVKDSDNEYILKTSGLFHSSKDIERVIINTDENSYNLNELATVTKAYEPKQTFSYLNENECINISIYKKSTSNPIKISKEIKKTIKNFEKEYPSITFTTIQDLSNEIIKSIISVLLSALVSSLITYFVIYYFFRNRQISFFLSLPIPLCILFSILCLKITGRSANLLSLSGISISIGMLVDASIVVIENILSKSKNKIDDETLYSAITEVKTSTVNSSLTTIIVFTPFFLFPGNFGELFSDLAVSVISSIFLSALIALTLIPACYKSFLTNKNNNINELKHILKLENKYQNYLFNLSSVNFSKKLIISLIILSSLCIPFSLLLKKELSSQGNTNKAFFTIDFPPNQSITKIETEIKNITREIKANSKNTQVLVTSGLEISDYNKVSNAFFNQNTAFFTIISNKKINRNKITDFFMNHNLSIKFIDEKDFISTALNFNSFYIFSLQSKEEINKILNTYPDAAPNCKTQEHLFISDPQKIAFYNISKSYISNLIYYTLEGIDAGNLRLADTEIPIKVKQKSSIEDFNSIQIPVNEKLIPLQALGNIKISEKEKTLFRYNKEDSKIITTPPDIKLNKDTAEDFKIISTAHEKIKEILLSAILLIILVIILLYCLLGAQLESFTKPFILLISIIPGFTGSLFSLLITGKTLNLNSLLSLIVLSGIAINNSIILLEAVDDKNIKHEDKITKLSLKIKPILITTITSIFSLIPFLFLQDTQSSMSVSLCGGLIFSCISSLIYIPLLLLNKEIK